MLAIGWIDIQKDLVADRMREERNDREAFTNITRWYEKKVSTCTAFTVQTFAALFPSLHLHYTFTAPLPHFPHSIVHLYCTLKVPSPSLHLQCSFTFTASFLLLHCTFSTPNSYLHQNGACSAPSPSLPLHFHLHCTLTFTFTALCWTFTVPLLHPASCLTSDAAEQRANLLQRLLCTIVLTALCSANQLVCPTLSYCHFAVKIFPRQIPWDQWRKTCDSVEVPPVTQRTSIVAQTCLSVSSLVSYPLDGLQKLLLVFVGVQLELSASVITELSDCHLWGAATNNKSRWDN